MVSTRLYLVRHGEQEPAGDGLSELGREQAGRLGRRLAAVSFAAMHHSPVTRAAQTAAIVAAHLPEVPRHACDFVFGVTGAADRHELVVTHNFVIGWFVRHVLDAPEWRWIGLNQANCGLTILRWDEGRPPALTSFNDTGHL